MANAGCAVLDNAVEPATDLVRARAELTVTAGLCMRRSTCLEPNSLRDPRTRTIAVGRRNGRGGSDPRNVMEDTTAGKNDRAAREDEAQAAAHARKAEQHEIEAAAAAKNAAEHEREAERALDLTKAHEQDAER